MSQDAALSLLYFSRFLGGIGVGMVSALVPSYVSECVPKSIRGRCTGMIQLANNIGIMLSCGSHSIFEYSDSHYYLEHSLGELFVPEGHSSGRDAVADSIHRANRSRRSVPHIDVVPTGDTSLPSRER